MYNGWSLFFLLCIIAPILFFAFYGAAALGKKLALWAEEEESKKLDETFPLDNAKLCQNQPHKWEYFRILNVEEVEPLDTPEQIEAKTKERLTCVKCGFVSGSDYMLGKKTIERLLKNKQLKDYDNLLLSIMREKRAKVIAEYTEKYSISAEALDEFDFRMANLASEAKLEAYIKLFGSK